MFPFLAAIFICSILIIIIMIVGIVRKPTIWKRNKRKIFVFNILWFSSYLVFILFFTGPNKNDSYPSHSNSPYLLPWKGGVKRFVAQGNRSFTSHRNLHLYAWDFVMPIGTPILAARSGTVVHVEVEHDGVQPLANYILIEHEDGIRTGYAHLRKNGSKVKVGSEVLQGQVIGYSGMVGVAPFPHLHFWATDKDGAEAKAITFRDVPKGYPRAGRFYTSGNIRK